MTRYAPVSTFVLESVGDIHTGYAAPAGGQAPCLVVLTADGTPVAYSRAARHSARAEADGRRRGWCGFALPGRALAMGLGDNVQIRCGVTDAVLAQPAFDAALLEIPAPGVSQISVIDVVKLARDGESCASVEQLAEFGRHHLHKHGLHSFLHATYQMFFRRDADNEIINAWLTVEDPDAEVETFLQDVVDSDENMAKPFRLLPGPFQSQFRYDKGLIG